MLQVRSSLPRRHPGDLPMYHREPVGCTGEASSQSTRHAAVAPSQPTTRGPTHRASHIMASASPARPLRPCPNPPCPPTGRGYREHQLGANAREKAPLAANAKPPRADRRGPAHARVRSTQYQPAAVTSTSPEAVPVTLGHVRRACAAVPSALPPTQGPKGNKRRPPPPLPPPHLTMERKWR